MKTISYFMKINGFLFQLSPQPFNEDVIEVTSPAIHGYLNSCLPEGFDPLSGSELTALIRIDDFRFSIFYYNLDL